MRWTVLVLAALATAPVAGRSVTYNKDIAPLTFRYCSSCHRPGEAAPFSLLTYQDVRKHAAQIGVVTQRGLMPPWLPEPGYGEFAGGGRLSAAQIQLIVDWVKQGAIEGKSSDLPPQPHFTEGWQMGQPDLIVQMPRPYRLAANGTDVFRNFVVPINLTETRYVRALELRPGNKRVLHHANILIDRRRTLRHRDGEDGEPGFPGMEVVTEARSDSFDPDSHFLFWKPGTVIEPEPDGMSWRLDPGTDLVLNMHMQPSGKEEVIQPVIGLYFTPQAPRRRPILVQLEDDGALDIPAGSQDYMVTDHLKLPVNAEVLAIYPHAHYLGKKIEAWATLPDGARRWLIKIVDWDINWQGVYRYRKPVWLPKDSTIEMHITYDNSSANPRNPNNPPKQVRAGPRGEDEMGHVWLQLLPQGDSGSDPRVTIQEAWMLRRLEKYPGDFVAQCNLGALDVQQGKYADGVARFEQALQKQPASATARNGLGAGLLAEGRLDDAIRALREALRLDPLHLNARWNLSKALIRKGDLDGAAAEMNILLKQKADYSEAQAGLAMVYFLQHRYDDALPHFQEAVRLRPEDAEIRTNLGALLANRGDFEGAIQSFEQALKLNPKDTIAEEYLARARAALAHKQH